VSTLHDIRSHWLFQSVLCCQRRCKNASRRESRPFDKPGGFPILAPSHHVSAASVVATSANSPTSSILCSSQPALSRFVAGRIVKPVRAVTRTRLAESRHRFAENTVLVSLGRLKTVFESWLAPASRCLQVPQRLDGNSGTRQYEISPRGADGNAIRPAPRCTELCDDVSGSTRSYSDVIERQARTTCGEKRGCTVVSQTQIPIIRCPSVFAPNRHLQPGSIFLIASNKTASIPHREFCSLGHRRIAQFPVGAKRSAQYRQSVKCCVAGVVIRSSVLYIAAVRSEGGTWHTAPARI